MRIRTIKPEFWSHPVMARLPDEVQLLALALLCHADDEGYFMADPAIVRGACMPFRETLATISRSLAKLSEAGWIEVCESEKHGQIGHITNWEKHQKVDHARQSKIKAYVSRENFAKPRETLAPDQGTGNREQGREQGKEQETPKASKRVFVDPDALEIPAGLVKYKDDIKRFVLYRKEDKRDPFTPRGFEAFLGVVKRLHQDCYEIAPLVDKAIASGWKTLFANHNDRKRQETMDEAALRIARELEQNK